MLIVHILKDKGDKVYTLSSEATLEEASRELGARRVGALVVVDEAGAPVGVLSERDIIREIAGRGAAALTRTAASAMSRGVITADPNETVDDGLARMTERRVRHLPVMGRGQLMGVVSIGDLVKHKIAEVEEESAAMHAYIAAR
ncbi:MAG: CBS domain-containing protein [Hyphomonadaceae bacterium]